MLSLMCSLYRGENYIPKNRPDLYEKCSLMLFERWDRGRGIHIQLPFEAHIRPAMMHLAEWVYSTPQLQTGVTEKRLVDKTTEYLCPRCFEDRDEAEKAAREFIEFCRGRAWVFSDVGTTQDGERIYQFTHRTFLEYFAAKHLARLNPTPEALTEVLFPRIAKQEWDVVAQLVFQIANNNVEGAGDMLLGSLVASAEEDKGGKSFAMLSFAARCLEFMVPSPGIVRQIVTACLEACNPPGSWPLADRDGLKALITTKHGPIADPFEILTPFVRTGRENLSTLLDACGKYVEELFTNENDELALLSLEIAVIGLRHHPKHAPSRVMEFVSKWDSIWQGILGRRRYRLCELSRQYWLPCLIGFFEGSFGIEDAIEWHGFSCLFLRPYSKISPGLSFAPSAESLLSIFWAEDVETHHLFDVMAESLAYIGEFALSQATPLVKAQEFHEIWGHATGFFTPWRVNPASVRETLPELGPDALFGALVLVLTAVEGMEGNQTRGDKRLRIPDVRNDFLSIIRSIDSVRYEAGSWKSLSNLLTNYGFSVVQKQLIEGWVKREIHLVG